MPVIASGPTTRIRVVGKTAGGTFAGQSPRIETDMLTDLRDADTIEQELREVVPPEHRGKVRELRIVAEDETNGRRNDEEADLIEAILKSIPGQYRRLARSAAREHSGYDRASHQAMRALEAKSRS